MKQKIAVWLPSSSSQLERQLAVDLGLPLLASETSQKKEFPLRLILDSSGIGIMSHRYPKQKPYYVNFASPTFCARTRQAPHSRELLIHAVGKASHVVDATAGFGKDAFLLAAAGYSLTLLEKNPIIFRLLQNGIERAQQNPQLSTITEKMELIQEDSAAYLGSLTALHFPEVIYLDPMFPTRQKSACVKKEAVLLQEITQATENDTDPHHELFLTALKRATRRIVVKRPRLAPPLAGKTPAFSLTGKAIRFDIYLPQLERPS